MASKKAWFHTKAFPKLRATTVVVPSRRLAQATSGAGAARAARMRCRSEVRLPRRPFTSFTRGSGVHDVSPTRPVPCIVTMASPRRIKYFYCFATAAMYCTLFPAAI
jgi:hypothetical protein